MFADLLLVEQTPPSFNTAELFIFPLLIKVLKVEVPGTVLVCLANERIQELLQVINGCKRRSVVGVASITRLLERKKGGEKDHVSAFPVEKSPGNAKNSLR